MSELVKSILTKDKNFSATTTILLFLNMLALLSKATIENAASFIYNLLPEFLVKYFSSVIIKISDYASVIAIAGCAQLVVLFFIAIFRKIDYSKASLAAEHLATMMNFVTPLLLLGNIASYVSSSETSLVGLYNYSSISAWFVKTGVLFCFLFALINILALLVTVFIKKLDD